MPTEIEQYVASDVFKMNNAMDSFEGRKLK